MHSCGNIYMAPVLPRMVRSRPPRVCTEATFRRLHCLPPKKSLWWGGRRGVGCERVRPRMLLAVQTPSTVVFECTLPDLV